MDSEEITPSEEVQPSEEKTPLKCSPKVAKIVRIEKKPRNKNCLVKLLRTVDD